MKVTIEFDSMPEYRKHIRDESGVEVAEAELCRLREELNELKNERVKTLISSDVVSDTYSQENIENVVNFIEEKAMNYEMKYEEPIAYGNLYSNVIRRVIREYPTLNRKVSVALFRSAWDYGVKTDIFYKDKKKKVILKKRMVGNAKV
jgi:hypothetical protein